MYELIREYKETRNQDLFEKILKEHKGLMYRVVGKYRENSLYSYEDMHQLCLIALMKAIDTYDENMDIKFSSYLFKLMNRALAVEICITPNRKKRKAKVSSLDICGSDNPKKGNKIIESIEDENVNIEEDIMIKVTKEFAMECIKDYKEKHQKKYMAVELILQGHSYRSAETLLPYSRQMVSKYWEHFSNYLKQRAITEGILDR